MIPLNHADSGGERGCRDSRLSAAPWVVKFPRFSL